MLSSACGDGTSSWGGRFSAWSCSLLYALNMRGRVGHGPSPRWRAKAAGNCRHLGSRERGAARPRGLLYASGRERPHVDPALTYCACGKRLIYCHTVISAIRLAITRVIKVASTVCDRPRLAKSEDLGPGRLPAVDRGYTPQKFAGELHAGSDGTTVSLLTRSGRCCTRIRCVNQTRPNSPVAQRVSLPAQDPAMPCRPLDFISRSRVTRHATPTPVRKEISGFPYSIGRSSPATLEFLRGILWSMPRVLVATLSAKPVSSERAVPNWTMQRQSRLI
ncbi:hypothetical protein MPNTM1_04072 [Mycolicibacterium parafortuitum]